MSTPTLRGHIHILICYTTTPCRYLLTYTTFETRDHAMHYSNLPLDKALDGPFGGHGILLHYHFPVFNEGIGLKMGSA